ncbi:TlpA family protein disulfide reductase [Shewanella rhizosphaerae]|uniref:TlpA family protein disulfide reductase n=1 Tax=Shewanella rhizosphaerae TaxID=2864207 RepID=UPI001C656978|nr:TlpA disulfide reductase family protein [Shewanella rhizosphaerae]QYK12315.1 TlpA family protein disulfide reductase [Shewanella rhizosphaerae]
MVKLVFILCLTFAINVHADSYDQKVNASLKDIGKQITNIELINTEGQPKTFMDLKGTTYIVYFFASWCSPCYKSLKNIEQIRITNDLSINILGVALDDDRDAVSKMLKDTGFKGEVWISKEGRVPLLNRMFGNAYKALPYVIKVDENMIIKEHSYDISSKEHWEKVLVENMSFKDSTAL